VFSEKDPVRAERQQHERLLELSRRLRAVVRELGRYAREERGGDEHAIDAPEGNGQPLALTAARRRSRRRRAMRALSSPSPGRVHRGSC